MSEKEEYQKIIDKLENLKIYSGYMPSVSARKKFTEDLEEIKEILGLNEEE